MCSSDRRWRLWGFRTVRGRLTAAFALVFALSAGITLSVSDRVLRKQLRGRLEEELLAGLREFPALYDEYGLEVLRDEFQREADSLGAENVFLLFRSPNRQILTTSDLTAWTLPGAGSPPLENWDEGAIRWRTLEDAGNPLALVAETVTPDGDLITIGRTMRLNRELLAAYHWAVGTAVAILMTIGVLLAWTLATRSLAGVRRVTRAAERISREDDLSQRVPAGRHGEEAEELADAFNQMLGRIGTLVSELRHVTDDIAHDLRSPVTRIRGLAEPLLTARGTPVVARDLAADVVVECDRLESMVDTLLEISTTQAGANVLERSPVDLAELLADACDLFEPLAVDGGVTLSFKPPAQPLRLSADRARLQRAVANLVDNAVKFTPAGGTVRVAGTLAEGLAEITVADNGPGIPETDRTRVFRRFHRGDSSRSTLGNGLGDRKSVV